MLLKVVPECLSYTLNIDSYYTFTQIHIFIYHNAYIFLFYPYMYVYILLTLVRSLPLPPQLFEVMFHNYNV